MSANYKFWCRLCGNLQSQPIADESYLDLIHRVTDLLLPSDFYACNSCQSQLEQFSLFIQKVSDLNELFKGLDDEDEDDLCLRRLNAYRSHFQLSKIVQLPVEPEKVEYELIDDTDAIVEEIFVETTEMEAIEDDDTSETFLYHMTDSNKFLRLFNFQCHLCDQPAYPNMRLLIEHCQNVHETQPSVKCCSDDCGKMLQTWRRLMIHKEKHFPSDEAMTCDVCHTVFATRAGFEKHKKTHNRQFICSFCAKIFSEQKTLKFHEATHQAPLEARRSFECPNCELKFITKQACQNHISMKHEKVVTVSCPLDGCGKGFFTRKAMLEHQRTHREPTFKCSDCDFMSKTKSQLNVHMERHSARKRRERKMEV